MEAPASDFVVQCFYVGVRARDAAAAPGNPAARVIGGGCDDVVALSMTDQARPAAAQKLTWAWDTPNQDCLLIQIVCV